MDFNVWFQIVVNWAGSFQIVIQRLFREMLYRCHFIAQVHPMIMTGLVFDKELFLTSIGESVLSQNK